MRKRTIERGKREREESGMRCREQYEEVKRKEKKRKCEEENNMKR